MAGREDNPRERTIPRKIRQAAWRADRPGEDCKAAPQTWTPHVDFHRCEGKGDCADVCPFGVFEVRRIDPQDYGALPLFTKLKLSAHGRKVAYTPQADACLACGLCVVACPEHAIALIPRAG
jgi:4Fe-4S ferredoxin